MKKEEKRYDLCKAFVDMKEEGTEEGKREYLVRNVCIKLKKSKPEEVIADELEEELSEIEKIIEEQKSVGCYDVYQICVTLMK